MSFGKTVTFNDGNVMPRIGLGTWLSKPGEVKTAVEHAVKTGYRHLDLAKIYQNQGEVGEALKQVIPSVVKREELFLTSKLWNNAHRPALVEKALKDTLSELGVEYLDLYLIHWPAPLDSGDDINNLMPKDEEGKFAQLDFKTTLVDTWKAMIELQKKGLVKSIGVSNFTQAHIEGIIKATGVVPAVNQIELHPLLHQFDLVEYCRIKGIHVTAYSPLGNSSGVYGKEGVDILNSKPVTDVAKQLGCEAGQVLIAWGARRGTSVIPKSVTPKRIESNFQEVELDEAQFLKINLLTREHGHRRFNIPYNYPWDINIFDEDIEFKATHRVRIGA